MVKILLIVMILITVLGCAKYAPYHQTEAEEYHEYYPEAP